MPKISIFKKKKEQLNDKISDVQSLLSAKGAMLRYLEPLYAKNKKKWMETFIWNI